jgi:hypothetical protein
LFAKPGELEKLKGFSFKSKSLPELKPARVLKKLRLDPAELFEKPGNLFSYLGASEFLEPGSRTLDLYKISLPNVLIWVFFTVSIFLLFELSSFCLSLISFCGLVFWYVS